MCILYVKVLIISFILDPLLVNLSMFISVSFLGEGYLAFQLFMKAPSLILCLVKVPRVIEKER